VSIIGAGLAGVEAAHVLAAHGLGVDLFEMRPAVSTPAHRTGLFAELVCSNSFKGTDPLTAHGILKAEMEMLGSLVLSVARATRVPAGKALAVDRAAFAATVTERIMALQTVTLHREEVTVIDPARLTIVATGPLTSDALAGASHPSPGATGSSSTTPRPHHRTHRASTWTVPSPGPGGHRQTRTTSTAP
jgi:methylenetetrahydrofolate--tRNA-(uracil-5-)-methyltransferase